MTTFLALLALAVSVAALSWQIVTWLRSGPALEVRLYSGFHPPELAITVPTTVMMAWPTPALMWIVEVSNNGRQAITISNVRLKTRHPVHGLCDVAATFRERVGPYGPQELPVVLEPGAVVTFYTSKQLPAHLRVRGPANDVDRLVIPEVRVGSRWKRGKFHPRLRPKEKGI